VNDQRDWLEEHDAQELPPRPRRRLLGVGANPVPLALLGVLLLACGFIAGVLVQKGQGSASSSTAGGLASRFAALRSAASGSASGASGAVGGSGGFFGAGGRGGGGSGATVGQVAYVSGRTLYVTDAEGNTIKVSTSAASTVTKTLKADVKGIHPGETVIVTGSTGPNGALSAESIRVSEAAGGGGLGALFGGGGVGGGSRGTGSTTGARAGAGEPALFGK
jgi:DNA-binding beta-propeller fold protein YncE